MIINKLAAILMVGLFSSLALADDGLVCAPLTALKNLERLMIDSPWSKHTGKPSEIFVVKLWVSRVAVRGMEIQATTRDCECVVLQDAATELELSAIAASDKGLDTQKAYLDGVPIKVDRVRIAANECTNVMKL